MLSATSTTRLTGVQKKDKSSVKSTVWTHQVLTTICFFTYTHNNVSSEQEKSTLTQITVVQKTVARYPRAGCFIIFSFLLLKMTGCDNLHKGHCLDTSQQSPIPAKPPVVLKYWFQQWPSFLVIFALENLGGCLQLNRPALLTGVDKNIWTKKHKCGRHLKAIWSSWNACKRLYTWREFFLNNRF